MNASKRNRTSKILAITCVFTMLVCSLAYFTDRVETQAQVTAGTVGITESDTWAANLMAGPQSLNNINPGDSRDLSFTVTNTGNKAVDVRHTIQLSVVDKAGNPKAMSVGEDWSNFSLLQFDLYKASDVTTMSGTNAAGYNGGYVLADTALPVFSSDSVNTGTKMGAERDISRINEGIVKYYFADSVLDGIGTDAETNYADPDQNTTALEDTAVASLVTTADGKNAVKYDYVLIFRDTTLNDFQGCTIYVDMEVEAKQHLNTRSSWQNIETISTTLNASPVASQNTAVEVAPDNHIGVLEDVNKDTAGTYNNHNPH